MPSYRDWINTDADTLNKMDITELREAVGRLRDVANKRYASGEEVAPAIRSLSESGGKISTRGKNVNQLRNEFARARDFLKMKTSTRRGYAKHVEDVAERLGTSRDELEGREDLGEFWDFYERGQDLWRNVAYEARQRVAFQQWTNTRAELGDGATADDVLDHLRESIDEIYEAFDDGEGDEWGDDEWEFLEL